ncbi:ATP-dependent RNA helicase DbpA [Thalassotalea agarivorans]|uniref:ATP-dependent RNA helicase DbpA n=2 Tax=Thalassotalea agarivorans TaxID=349064 RepID=A0A1I0FHX8_THASX|nr:ATP-dependent RNA helicase DbpA [Thalassotalea agarivorans]
MTAIQASSLPHIINGKDIIAQAKTGSGKTAAFGLGVIQNLDVSLFRIQSLVLCPTRELADQVAKEIRRLARTIHNIKVLTLCGGMPFGPQKGSLEHGAHIIVGTPGRIEDHLSRGTLNLNHLNTLVLDEADRMLDMGFQDALDNIINQCPRKRQTLLFSATYPKQIQQIAASILNNPETVKEESLHQSASIDQHFFQVSGNEQRLSALEILLNTYQPVASVIFCTTKAETSAVANALVNSGYSCVALHGDLEQRDRDQTLVQFANKSARILVATDVAARGLDIDNVELVINYHLPKDSEVYVHRIGRTGRGDSHGLACTLISDKEIPKLLRLEEYMKQPFETEPLPTISESCKPLSAQWTTIQIDAGKKQKLRPGDILGALTSSKQIKGDDVGKIHMFSNTAFVAIAKPVARKALALITNEKMKGRKFRARQIR